MDSSLSSCGYFVPYDSQGQLLTCDSNSCVKILSSEDFVCRHVLNVSASSGCCVAVWKRNDGEDAIALTTTDNAVRVFGHKGEGLGLLLRFSAAVNHMDINLSQTTLAAASSDFCIKLADTKTMQQVAVLSGHTGPVLAVKFGPRGKYLASTSADGTLKIWLLEKKECLKTVNCLPKFSAVNFSHPLGRLAWEDHCGSAVVVPCGKAGIKLFSYGTWTESATLCCSGEPKVFSIACWSPSGRLLAGASLDACVTIWSAPQLQVVQSIAQECAVCCMAFTPDSGGITVMDTKGQLYPLEVETEYIGFDREDFTDDFREGSEMDNLDVYDNALLDEGDVDEVCWKQERKRNHSEVDHADMSDEGEGYVGSSALASQSYKKRRISESTSLLPAFQIGETPRGNPNRFMVYNSVGIVRSHEGDSSSIATVEVEFHDIATYHALTLPNPVNYEMASLTSRGLALASKGDDDSNSQLHCVHFEDWDSSKEWTITMDKREHIQAVTQGNGWVAVATDVLNLRVFSTGGVQKGLLSLPGPVLTMAGFQQNLAVAFQGGLNVFGQSSVHLYEVNVVDHAKSLGPTMLPLSPKGALKWLGYSASGVLASYDSAGVLRVAPSTNRTHWVPVLNTSKLKSKQDTYFAVELSEDPDEFRCILCKGADHPSLHPRPVMMTLPLQVPLCDVSSERGKLEEEFVRQTTLQPSNATGISKCLMKMFALACKSGRQMRAVEIAELFPNQQCLSVALTYSSKHRLHGLSERISHVIQAMEEEGELAADPESDSVADASFNPRTTSSSLSCAQRQPQGRLEPLGAPQTVLLSRAARLPGKEPERCTAKSLGSGKTLAVAEAEDIGKMCEPEETSAQLLPANPFKTSVKASCARSESVLQSMAKATVEMVKRKDPKAVPQKKGEALDAQYSKVQQNLKAAFLACPAVPVPASGTAPRDNHDNSSTSEQSTSSGPSGFSKWLSENKPTLQQAHVGASHEELVKLGIKQWRAMTKEEKQQWQ